MRQARTVGQVVFYWQFQTRMIRPLMGEVKPKVFLQGIGAFIEAGIEGRHGHDCFVARSLRQWKPYRGFLIFRAERQHIKRTRPILFVLTQIWRN